jgi:hypothetical protein
VAKSICSVEGCNNPVQGRGWCHTHYERWRRHGDAFPDIEPRPRQWEGPCSVEGCDKQAKLKGWCNAHYQRWRAHGDPTGGGKPHDGTRAKCSVDGCEKHAVARGWCDAHYRRWKRSGEVGDAYLRKLGSGEDVGYNTAHRRVSTARGPASRHDCVSCGSPAREWAYDHADPDARIASSENPRIAGMPYSLNADHYQPMCKACHKKFDMAHTKGN